MNEWFVTSTARNCLVPLQAKCQKCIHKVDILDAHHPVVFTEILFSSRIFKVGNFRARVKEKNISDTDIAVNPAALVKCPQSYTESVSFICEGGEMCVPLVASISAEKTVLSEVTWSRGVPTSSYTKR